MKEDKMNETNWFIKGIKRYKENNWGVAWNIFWKFRDKNNIFSIENSKESATQLFCYLCCFGMARASTELSYSNLEDFHKFYIDSLESFRELNKFKFESFDKVNKDDFLKYYSNIQDNLKKINVSPSNTMVTKILMAVTGQVPAFDTFFIKSFRKRVGTFSGDVYDALSKLHNKYFKEWQEELRNLDNKYKTIIDENGEILEIPLSRLIDMGFWSYSDENLV